jgi:hypothetical protein
MPIGMLWSKKIHEKIAIIRLRIELSVTIKTNIKKMVDKTINLNKKTKKTNKYIFKKRLVYNNNKKLRKHHFFFLKLNDLKSPLSFCIIND